ncbi:MAG: helix-turn-helix transcriptional regulator [Hydrogenibacillus schlegelii]|nr:helix-turn-helix transcriptional regulator [Hydrogenibacillus schlegelii]
MNELAQYVKQVLKDDPLFLETIDDSIEKRVAYHVKRLRKALKLTQADLAEKMGVKQPFVARIESGKNNISIRKLAELAQVLGVDPMDLVRPIYTLGHPDTVVRLIVSRRFRIMAVNPGGVRYFGRPQLELVHTLLSHESPFRRAAEQVFQTGEPAVATPVEGMTIEARPIRNGRGQVIGAELTYVR